MKISQRSSRAWKPVLLLAPLLVVLAVGCTQPRPTETPTPTATAAPLEKSVIGDIKQKAEEQIERAQTAINQLEAELRRNQGAFGDTAQSRGATQSARFDCPKDCICFPSTNTSAPNYSPTSGYEIYCMRGSAARVRGAFEESKKAFSEGKYSEALGLAIAAEVLARSDLREMEVAIKAAGVQKTRHDTVKNSIGNIRRIIKGIGGGTGVKKEQMTCPVGIFAHEGEGDIAPHGEPGNRDFSHLERVKQAL
ncbi:MAG: hypothetical protein AAB037_02215, partial [Chloroflexota bacterium]